MKHRPITCLPIYGAALACFALGLTVCQGRDVQLLLLAGQSNMVGRAMVSDTLPGDSPLDGQIQYYYSVTNVAGEFNSSSRGTFGDLRPWSSAGQQFFGPETSLARKLAEQSEQDLAIIKLAVGGSDIGRWQPGQIDYEAFLAAALDGIAELQIQGAAVNVAGMVWLQGESDMLTTTRANEYEPNLGRLFAGLRSDLSNEAAVLGLKDLKLFLVEPADWRNGSMPQIASAENIEKVKQGLLNYANSDPHAWHISTSDLTEFGDGVIHFSAQDQVTLGHRIAAAIITQQIPEPASFILPLLLASWVSLNRRHTWLLSK